MTCLIGIEEFAPESHGNCYKVKTYQNKQTFCLKESNKKVIIFSIYERSSALSSSLGLTWCWTPTWSLGYLKSTPTPPCSQTRQVAFHDHNQKNSFDLHLKSFHRSRPHNSLGFFRFEGQRPPGGGNVQYPRFLSTSPFAEYTTCQKYTKGTENGNAN